VPGPYSVQLQQVSKLYGSFAALRRVSLDCQPAQCVVILGPNGAGKSTLLRVIAGLIAPSHGAVTLFGAPAAAASRHRIGYLGHDSMLYDELTAAENLRYTARLYAGHTTTLLSPEDALTLVALDPALDRPVSAYSQGMRQRAALARVLMPSPELLLLDEPFSNIDAASSARMLEVLAQLRSAGTTILLTTHQPELARPIADVFCTMQAGQIAALDPLHTPQAGGVH
jgi:heme ABC exporter ATP-binding subunit CcmA